VGTVTLIGLLLAWTRPTAVYWEPGRDAERLVVKTDSPPTGAVPYVPGASGELARYWLIQTSNAEVLGTLLLADPRVQTAYLAPMPVPPPLDISPETPEFRADQLWLDSLPGVGLNAAADWPGGDGSGVTVADVEYGWEEDHEDLEAAEGAGAWGSFGGLYEFHGSGVLGMLVGGDNGYGITGGVPAAAPRVFSPFSASDEYNVAASIAAAASELGPGDVLLIEQQGYVNDTYCPVSVEPAVFDAVQAAVEAGIVVVEPAGNGGSDLDDPLWEGAFDADSGAIIVGAGWSGLGTEEGRTLAGSDYGSPVDLQGWYDSIVTASAADGDPSYTELYFPNEDGRQAYTASFGGSSGASAMIAAVAAAAQSVAIRTRGAPLDPADLRAALVLTGTPASGVAANGSLPDLRRFLRTYLVP
jgi:hypothetical protein